MIEISSSFYECLILNEKIKTFRADDGNAWTGPDEQTGRLRLQFMLASTMVHELLHAFWNALVGNSKAEPFYQDTRVAELGWTWEKEFFSGMIHPNTTCKAAPYGSMIERWPRPFPCEPSERELMSYAKWQRGHWHVTHYALEMSWVQRFFTKDFWEAIDRCGMKSARPARMLGVRYASKKWKEYRSGESPTRHDFEGRPRRSPSSPRDHTYEYRDGKKIAFVDRYPRIEGGQAA